MVKGFELTALAVRHQCCRFDIPPAPRRAFCWKTSRVKHWCVCACVCGKQTRRVYCFCETFHRHAFNLHRTLCLSLILLCFTVDNQSGEPEQVSAPKGLKWPSNLTFSIPPQWPKVTAQYQCHFYLTYLLYGFPNDPQHFLFNPFEISLRCKRHHCWSIRVGYVKCRYLLLVRRCLKTQAPSSSRVITEACGLLKGWLNSLLTLPLTESVRRF